jgi:hypothetical protein
MGGFLNADAGYRAYMAAHDSGDKLAEAAALDSLQKRFLAQSTLQSSPGQFTSFSQNIQEQLAERSNTSVSDIQRALGVHTLEHMTGDSTPQAMDYDHTRMTLNAALEERKRGGGDHWDMLVRGSGGSATAADALLDRYESARASAETGSREGVKRQRLIEEDMHTNFRTAGVNYQRTQNLADADTLANMTEASKGAPINPSAFGVVGFDSSGSRTATLTDFQESVLREASAAAGGVRGQKHATDVALAIDERGFADREQSDRRRKELNEVAKNI